MDNPGARSLMDLVRQINEMGRRARSGEPGVEDYLRILASDPTTKWFTELLREKSAELEKERKRADELTSALRAWYQAKQAGSEQAGSEAESQLVQALRRLNVVNS